MPIERDFDLVLDQKVLSATQGKGFARLLKRPKIAQIFAEIQADLPQFYEPQLIWDIFPVKQIDEDCFLLENGSKVGGGPVVQVMEEATHIIIGMCTVGPRCDAQIDKYSKEGNNLAAVILDGIASFLVDQIRETFFNQTAQKYKNQDKFSSIPLCPGESDWDVTDHSEFFALLRPEQIGMSLRTSMLMIPMKSLSFMIGVSDQPFALNDQKRCDFCPRRTKCRYSQSELGKTLCN